MLAPRSQKRKQKPIGCPRGTVALNGQKIAFLKANSFCHGLLKQAVGLNTWIAWAALRVRVAKSRCCNLAAMCLFQMGDHSSPGGLGIIFGSSDALVANVNLHAPQDC